MWFKGSEGGYGARMLPVLLCPLSSAGRGFCRLVQIVVWLGRTDVTPALEWGHREQGMGCDKVHS